MNKLIFPSESTLLSLAEKLDLNISTQQLTVMIRHKCLDPDTVEVMFPKKPLRFKAFMRGETRYSANCRVHGVVERYIASGQCVLCSREGSNRSYKSLTEEQLLARKEAKRRWAEGNSAYVLQYQKAYDQNRRAT